MHTHRFSDAQAAHALEVVLKLKKERRFFLFQQSEYSQRIEGDLGHGLDPSIFHAALRLEDASRTVYSTTLRIAEQNIENWERSLGFLPPNLDDNKRVVECKRHTGGLDICRVYPTTAFTEFAPSSLAELRIQEVERLMDGKAKDSHSPDAMREFETRAEESARKIWEDVETIKSLSSGNSCMVLLRTRSNVSNKFPSEDLLQGALDGIQLYQYGMGYLFYQYSKRTRIMDNNFALCGTSYRNHVVVHHWHSGELKLRLEKASTYSCKVYVPIVL